jgi:hypothetical protein
MHQHGHLKPDARDVMPSGASQEDSSQLNRKSYVDPFSHLTSTFLLAVTRERVHYLETEEVQRVKDVERHGK